jgi:hypothetical protein
MKPKTNNHLVVTILEYGFTALAVVLSVIFFGRFIYALLFNQ